MKELILRHKLFFGTIIFLVLLVIPLTVFQAQQQQDLRQRADEHIQEVKPKVGIRLCHAEPLNPPTNISACDSEIKESSFRNYPVQIVAVNNSGPDVGSVDISAFELELQYDSKNIKYLAVDRRNGSNYEIIQPSTDTDLAVPGDTRKTIHIVGVGVNKSISRNVERNGVLTLASIHVEPKPDSSSTGIEILPNSTRVTVKGFGDKDLYGHLPNGLNFEKRAAQVQATGVPAVTSAPGAAATPTPIPVASTATPTLAPTTTPAPTSTPIPAGVTAGSFSIDLAGIVDNPNRKNRKLKIEIFDPEDENKKIADLTADITHDSSTKRFKGENVLNAIPKSGIYNIKVKSDGYLRKLILSVRINKGGQNNISQVALIPGDINGDNRIDLLDYNIIQECNTHNLTLSPRANEHSANCKKFTDQGINLANANLDDDDVVGGTDFNIFITGLSVREGD